MSDSILDLAKAADIAYNNADWDALAAVLSDDITYTELATGRVITGRGQVIEAWQGWKAAFSDTVCSFDDEFVAGNTVTLQITWRGTHDGPMHTPDGNVIPATGKTIELPACQIIEVKDGKQVKNTQYFCMLTMLSQLGLA